MVRADAQAVWGAGVNIAALELELTDAEIDEARATFTEITDDPPDIAPEDWEEYAERTYARLLRNKLADRARL